MAKAKKPEKPPKPAEVLVEKVDYIFITTYFPGLYKVPFKWPCPKEVISKINKVKIYT